MKIAFVAPAKSWHIVRWFNALRDDLEIRVYTLDPMSAVYGDRQVVLQGRGPNNKMAYLFSVRDLRKELAAFKPDIVHAHYATGYGFMASRLGLHPLVVSVWGSDVFTYPGKSFLHKAVLKSVLFKAETICATSEILRNQVISLFPKLEARVVVVPFGIDTQLFKPLPRQESRQGVILGTVRNLYKIYQIDLLLKIFDKLAKADQSLTLRIAGNGPEKDRLIKLQATLPSRDRITFAGEINNRDLPAFLSELDIFVMPSRFESYGVAALEASACGLPVVAFKVGGIPEIVEDGVSGILVRPGEIVAFEQALGYLIKNPQVREKLGKSGRELAAQKFDIGTSAEKMKQVYASLVN